MHSSLVQDELESVSKEVVMAKDKLATDLYNVLSQEANWAQNLGEYLNYLQVNC